MEFSPKRETGRSSQGYVAFGGGTDFRQKIVVTRRARVWRFKKELRQGANRPPKRIFKASQDHRGLIRILQCLMMAFRQVLLEFNGIVGELGLDVLFLYMSS